MLGPLEHWFASKHPKLAALNPATAWTELATQVSAAPAFRIKPEDLPEAPDHTFVDNEGVWGAVQSENMRGDMFVKLEDFLLFDWLPRAPGRYHTDYAKVMRRMAMEEIRTLPGGGALDAIDHAEQMQRSEDVAYQHYGDDDHLLVFNPGGKSLMLEGGIGCVRLDRMDLSGDKVWFMSASSTGVGHEGFPVAVPDNIRERYRDRLEMQGVIPCTLQGRLRFIADYPDLVMPYAPPLPKTYLLLEEIQASDKLTRHLDSQPNVSVPVVFESSYRDEESLYSSYVTFYPGIEGSFESRIDWLKRFYVEELYKGRIVADFDQRQPDLFDDVVLGLDKVVNGRLDEERVRELTIKYGLYGDLVEIHQQIMDRVAA